MRLLALSGSEPASGSLRWALRCHCRSDLLSLATKMDLAGRCFRRRRLTVCCRVCANSELPVKGYRSAFVLLSRLALHEADDQ